MSPRALLLILPVLAGTGGCAGSSSSSKPARRKVALDTIPVERRDAALLGREVFRLVDRAADYKGSHLGHPPTTLQEMGVESLAPVVVRRIRVVSDSPVITVAFRATRGRRVASCEGMPAILEEASLSGGMFTVVCTTPSGELAKYQVPAP